jgi:hypothetical protein
MVLIVMLRVAIGVDLSKADQGPARPHEAAVNVEPKVAVATTTLSTR